MDFMIKQVDREFYQKELKDFLPDKIIDIHTHVYAEKNKIKTPSKCAVAWPSLVANENTGEQLREMYKLMFPDKEITPLMFSLADRGQDFDLINNYVAEMSAKYTYPSLYYSRPEETPEQLTEKCRECNFLGLKSYLTLTPDYIPENEIRIYDFLPRYQFEAANKHGWIVMLHIPRPGRLGDAVNIAQLLEIDKNYPNAKVIVAHIGRAYADSDAGDAFKRLAATKNLLFDFSANTNKNIIKRAIETFGVERVLFGSDAPITRMRTKRIIRDNTYINLVPKGLYGDETNIPHLEGVTGYEADHITFFLYEQLYSFKCAAIELSLAEKDIEAICYSNAKNIIGL